MPAQRSTAKVRTHPLGEAALLAELGTRLDTALNTRAIALAAALKKRRDVRQAIAGYSTVTVHSTRTRHRTMPSPPRSGDSLPGDRRWPNQGAFIGYRPNQGAFIGYRWSTTDLTSRLSRRCSVSM